VGTNSEIAANAIKTIHDLWKIDSDCVEWVGDTSADTILKFGYGFDWWPGDFRVQVRVHGPHPELDVPVYRLSAHTDFLRDVDVGSPDFARNVSILNRWSPTFAICACPTSVSDALGDYVRPKKTWLSKLFGRSTAEPLPEVDPKSSRVWLASNAYLIEQRADWLPHYFSGLALLQPIAAQSQAQTTFPVLGGKPDRSQAPKRGQRTDLDDMLGFGIDIADRGKAASAWIGTGEFAEIVDRWCRTESAYGVVLDESLYVEVPFGENPAVLRLLTNESHLWLGSGLLAVLQIPLLLEAEQAATTCASLNYMESAVWSKVEVPLIGSWSAQEMLNTDGAPSFYPEFRCFLPNTMYRSQMAELFALYMMKRARWARQTLLPDVVDAPMSEIVLRRVQPDGTA
jgi:hypothetical protein